MPPGRSAQVGGAQLRPCGNESSPEALLFCNRCGRSNPEGAAFCSVCAAVLDVGEEFTGPHRRPSNLGAETRSPRSSNDDTDQDVQRIGAALVVRGGDRSGETFAIARGITQLGRNSECQIPLSDVTVSRLHAQIDSTPAGFFIRDMESLNGTYVNRNRVEAARLENHDELQIGKYRFVFVTHDVD